MSPDFLNTLLACALERLSTDYSEAKESAYRAKDACDAAQERADKLEVLCRQTVEHLRDRGASPEAVKAASIEINNGYRVSPAYFLDDLSVLIDLGGPRDSPGD